jgi:deoxyxylulose-5-phosphate synthase
MGSRFINAGVAEQNMVSVAAGLASEGLEVWAYSIAPFIYARPFEQVRNDVSFHGLPVKLIGNGGGYGYGVMGPTHHAIEDYGVLLTLPAMTVYAPVFDEDVAAVVARAAANTAPGLSAHGPRRAAARLEGARVRSLAPPGGWRRAHRAGRGSTGGHLRPAVARHGGGSAARAVGGGRTSGAAGRRPA